MATQTATASYDFAGLEGVWNQAGGNQQAAGWAAAIAMAESGGQVFAHSPSNDVGLWQINATYHPPSQATYDVMGNARAAISISQDGKDWGPWCTAWANPSGNCGSYLGPTPQRGSKAYAMYTQYQGTPADMTVALNGTGAAANTAGMGAEQAAFLCPCVPGFTNICCVPGLNNVAGAVLKGIIDGILKPLVAPVVGVLGMAAGGVMVMFGIFLIVRQTDTYKTAKQGVSEVAGAGLAAAGMATGQPELMAAGAARGGVRGRVSAAGRQRIVSVRRQETQQMAAERGEAATGRFAQRSAIVGGRQSAQRQQETEALAARGQARTSEQLRAQALLYQQRQAQRQPRPSTNGNRPRQGRLFR